MDVIYRVFEEAQDVFINTRGIRQIAEEVMTYLLRNYNNHTFGEVTYNYVRLSTEFHPKKHDHRTVDWLFVLNTLNFGLWTRKGEPEWTVDGLTGYMALCAAIKRAINEEKPIWNPKYYTNISIADMKHIFRGDNDTTIRNIFQRLIILNIVGNHLLGKYKGTFANCIISCGHDPLKLMDLLQNEFQSYEDKVMYGGQAVQMHSKAWVLVADIWATFRDHELFLDMKILKFPTIFADYRVPQIFSHFNAIVYSKDFLDKLETNNETLMQGGREDLEIRCCSIVIIRHVYTMLMEKIDYFAERTMPELSFSDFDWTCVVDNFLWDYRQVNDELLKKYPLCKIITEQF